MSVSLVTLVFHPYSQRGDQMTRKHFVAIAGVLEEHHPGANASPSSLHWWRGLVASFANLCADTNPLFDSKRFMAACSPKRHTISMDCPRCGGPTSVSGKPCGEC